MGLGATTGESSRGFKFQFPWRRRSSNKIIESEKEQGANNVGADNTVVDGRGVDFDPSNEIAFLVNSKEDNMADRTTSDDGMPAYQTTDLDDIREELEELEGAREQIEEFEDVSQ